MGSTPTRPTMENNEKDLYIIYRAVMGISPNVRFIEAKTYDDALIEYNKEVEEFGMWTVVLAKVTEHQSEPAWG